MSDIIAGRNAVREALRGTRPIQKVLVLESGHGGHTRSHPEHDG